MSRRRLAAALVTLTCVVACAGCADGRESPTVLPPSKREARAVFVVIGGRESSGFGLEDALHSAWPQILFRRQFPDGTVYVNLARNDTTAAQARADQTPVAVEQHPTVAVVWLGEGDDIVGTRPAQFGQDLELLLTRLRQSGTGRVLVASPPSDAPGSQFAPQIASAARAAGAEVVRLSAGAWNPHAPRSQRASVQAAAADEFGRALK